jgi:dihydropteroate synthase
MLVSINRKNFLRQITGRSTEAALPVSLAATSMAVERGARVVRTHDVQETVDAAMVGDAFADAGGPAGATVSVTEMEAGEDRVGDDRTGERVFAVGGLTAAAAAEFSRAASAVDAVVRSGPGPDGLLLGVESQAIGALAERLPATPTLTTVAGRLRAHR